MMQLKKGNNRSDMWCHEYRMLLLLLLMSACNGGASTNSTTEQATEMNTEEREFYYGGDPMHPNDTGMRRYTKEYDIREQIERDGAEVEHIKSKH